MPGLLVNGQEIPVEGLTIINPNDTAWCRLDPKDFKARPTPWVRQIILHTTKGNSPQTVLPGKGPGGRARSTADYWRAASTCRSEWRNADCGMRISTINDQSAIRNPQSAMS